MKKVYNMSSNAITVTAAIYTACLCIPLWFSVEVAREYMPLIFITLYCLGVIEARLYQLVELKKEELGL